MEDLLEFVIDNLAQLLRICQIFFRVYGFDNAIFGDTSTLLPHEILIPVDHLRALHQSEPHVLIANRADGKLLALPQRRVVLVSMALVKYSVHP
jgi:hypothetical protein